jgi:hypothetical protein
VFNPDVAKLCRGPELRYVHKTFADAQGREIRVEVATQYEPATQILAFTLFYLQGADEIRTKSVRMRCFFPEELLALCRMAGFDVVHRYGAYDESPFKGDSAKQILFCRAKEAA